MQGGGKLLISPLQKNEEPRSEDSDSPVTKSSGPSEINEKPWEKSATIPRPKPTLTNSQRDSSSSLSSCSSPSSNTATTPVSRMKVVKKNSDGAGSDVVDMERIKQEILEEVKNELHKVKEEIIAALVQELQNAQLKCETS